MSALAETELGTGLPPEYNSDGSAHLSLVEPPAEGGVYLRQLFTRLDTQEQMALGWQVWTGQQAAAYLGRVAAGQEPPLEGQYRPYFDVAIEEGKSAREQLAVADYPMVLSLAKHFKDRGIETQELIQEGSIAMLKALDRYDPMRGSSVPSFIHEKVYWAMLRAVTRAQNGDMSTEYAELTVRSKKLTDQWIIDYGVPPSDEELTDMLKVSPEQLKILRRRQSVVRAIRLDDDETSQKYEASEYWDQQSEDPFAVASYHDQLRRVGSTINELNEVDRKILTLYYGIGDDQPRSLREVAQEVGLHHSHVDRRRRQALELLRYMLGGAEDED